MKSSAKNLIIRLNKDIFTVSIVSYAVFFFIEQIKSKFVIGYININYLLGICLISGFFVIFTEDVEKETLQKQIKTKMWKILLLSFLVFCFLYLFLFELKLWGVFISFIGALVAFLLLTILNE